MCLLNLLPLSFFPASDSCALMKFRQPSGHLWSLSSIISWGLRKNKVVLKCNMHSLKSSLDNSKGIFCLSVIDITWIFLACQLASFSCVLAFAALQGVPLVVLFSEITKKASFMCVCYIIMLVRILKLKKLRTSPGPSFGDCCAELSPEPQPVLWCLHLTLLSLLRSPLSFPPFQLLSLESPLSFPV